MAIRAATTGDSTAGTMTLFSTALRWIASSPPATQVAPIRPPNSACDELEGNPRYQVTRFHKIAPTSPAKMTTGLMSVSSTSPPEIVFATSTDRKAPTRFRQPATVTATFGRSAPVAIEVAIALAVSWKPLVKSKTSAVNTTTTTITDTSMYRALQWLQDSLPCACSAPRNCISDTVPTRPPRVVLPGPSRVVEGPSGTSGHRGIRRSGIHHHGRVRPRRMRPRAVGIDQAPRAGRHGTAGRTPGLRTVP